MVFSVVVSMFHPLLLGCCWSESRASTVRLMQLLVCETGTRSVAMVFRAVVFTFIPTAIELVLVCGLLARTFAPAVATLVIATFAAYVLWTASLTRAAAEVCQ